MSSPSSLSKAIADLAVADFDPLTGSNAPSSSASPTSSSPLDRPALRPPTSTGSHLQQTSSAAALSFKRRTASKGALGSAAGLRSATSGLLTGLLSSGAGGQEADLVPPSATSSPSKKSLRGSTSALAMGSESEEDEGEEERTGAIIGAAGIDGGLPKAGRWPTGAPAGRISFPQPLRDPSRWQDDEEDYSQSPTRGGGGGRANYQNSQSPSRQYDDAADLPAVGPTPLPKLPIVVLCLAMFGEFLCASTSSPFLYFMIEDFGIGQGPEGGGEAAVGFWTGIVGSVFFLSQFLTSLLWVSVAEKHGKRAVLFASLLGNACSLVAFGTSKNLGGAICARLTMGLFNGAVGVARSAVQNVTDSTNESQAFMLMGLAWGLGGIVGSIVGGLAENPVRNHPYFFANSALFAKYPYLLPCLISGSVTFSGSILSLFLGPDGGSREGGIHLPTEKDLTTAVGGLSRVPGRVWRWIGDKGWSRRQEGAVRLDLGPEDEAAVRRTSGVPPSAPSASAKGAPGDRAAGSSAFSGLTPAQARRMSIRTGAGGSAYGYDARSRLVSRGGQRAMSYGTSTRYAPDFEDLEHTDLNFAQRLLLANEPAVFSLSDLWVANATRNDDSMSHVNFGGNDSGSVIERSAYDDDDEESRLGIDEQGDEPDFFGYGTAPPSLEDLRGTAKRQDEERGREPPAGVSAAGSRAGSLAIPRLAAMRSPTRESQHPASDRMTSSRVPGFRRGSMASSVARAPSIFANTGLDPSSLGMPPSSVAEPTKAPVFSPGLSKGVDGGPGESAFNPMAAIPEGQRAPSIVERDEATLEELEEGEKEQPSLIWQLPLAMIAQYALLALHGTTCDQVFLSFLVTPVPSGGLGLKASNYAMLIATMFFFQTLWQFRFYPFVVAPRGFLSHLAMFRLGLALYMPVYFLFPELRGLLRENGSNLTVMFGMTLLFSIRYLASTCAYTAVFVLINAMSPPHLLPLANGLAQSGVSLARFIGPILGGTLWAYSIRDGPSAHAWPFNYALAFIVITCVCGVGFLHSWRIK